MKKPKMQILFAISIILISCLPVITNEGQSYTILQLLAGNVKTMNPVIPTQVPAVLLLITPIQYLIHMILLIRNNTDRYEMVILYLSLLTTVLGIICILLCGIGENGEFAVWVWLRMVLIIIAYVSPRVYESFQDFKQNEKVQKLEDQNERVTEKKSSEYMKKIKKNPYLKKILWKVYKSNMRNSILLVTGAIISSSFLFTTIAVYEMFFDLQKGNVPVVGDELSVLLWDAIILIGIISIFLLALSLKIYVKSRIKDYNLMITLGMRDRVLRFFIVTEYTGSLAVGLLIGIFIGSLLTIGFQSLIHSIYPAFISIELPGIKTYFIACFYIILLFLASTIINHEIYVEMELGSSRPISVLKEKMPNRWLGIKCVVGIILMLFSSYAFSKHVWTESIYLIIMFLVGCYMIIGAGGAWILKSYRRKGNGYYKRLPFLQQFCSRFKTHRSNFFMVYILHFLLIGYFSIRISGMLPLDRVQALFPYDYVCLGEKEDQETFKEFQKKFSEKSLVLPMVRVTVASASEENSGSGMNISFQGQNIGISESSYNQLTGRKLGLQNKEIYISFQQDKSEKAHLLDFSVLSGSPRMRFGMPEPYFFGERDKVFDSDYKVIGQERRIIVGNLVGGMQENIVVFSDEYFKSICSTGNGPSILALFNINKDKEEEAAVKFLDYAKDHIQYSEYDSLIQPIYGKKTLQNDTLLAHMLKLLEYLFVMILLLISILYVFIVKMVSELPDTQSRMKQFKYLGMRERLDRKILVFENNVMTIMPLVLAIVASILYIFITLKIRHFTKMEQQEFWQYEIWIIGGYTLINLIAAFIIGRVMICLGNREE
ncbi:FtsX-like permease family protein [Clostridium botulinum]|nr:FtsX-like permease family protein [Clostridium botulinum]APC84259.1 ftsX-like permease family protein [Clostridium botulinum]AXG97127.1 ABC transporter permease [Clostridium botulinum]EDT82202.1 putative ABC transporter, permease protein [Clostridium botulinum NCTC 2916]MBY6773424.1 FtsX-like permease family protein [Clostridium botulinum]MBY6776862.1 FtsX-like permease family protein [Clostridium botulinum]